MSFAIFEIICLIIKGIIILHNQYQRATKTTSFDAFLVFFNISSHSFNFDIILLQTALVSWSVSRGNTLDLFTVGNMTFSGDHKYSILHQKLNNWVLVIKEVDMLDKGKYICTSQTFPEQSLSVFVRVHGEKSDSLCALTYTLS